MKTVSAHSPDLVIARPRATRLDRLARRIVRSRLDEIENGQVVVSENGKHKAYGTLTADMPLTTQISVRHPAFYSEAAFGGTVGAAESYMRGEWDCSELTTLVRILLRNRDVLDNMESGFARLLTPVRRFLHWLNRNTRTGSRRNISAHYDLGNEFYRLWLDDRMMYSAGVFERPDMTLDEAGAAKLDRICRKLRLSPSDHVLEIGTGWGGFAIYAAENYGCRVTTTTISREQHDYAQEAIRAAGLEDRVTLLFSDYRDLEGKYDKLVSIEMIEAVGWQYHDVYFAKCSELLRDDGEMLLQAITIADQHYERYRKSVDFIRRYVFPGGCLCSLNAMSATLTRVTDMRSVHIEDIGPHYATTLKLWRERFEARLDDVRELGYPESFIRMWTYYLCYCEAAFLERAIGDLQLHLVKPGARADVVNF